MVLWKKKGDNVRMGERIGLMKFSSRMDVLIPPGIEICVTVGQSVTAGLSVIARIAQATDIGEGGPQISHE